LKKLLSDYKNNIHSQFGEDGIIQKLIEIVKPINKTCIDIGAWDGIHFSNTANLWIHNNWNGILFECDTDKYFELSNNVKNKNALIYNIMITSDNINNYLPEALYGLISIDIDGDDFHILNKMKCKSNILIIEYNPTFPKHVEYINEPGDNFGSSALSIVKLAELKGYALVSITDSNCIFVLNQYKDLFSDYELDFEKLFIDKYICYVYNNYSGDYSLSRDPVYGFRERLKR
jgi:hypothetical protein